MILQGSSPQNRHNVTKGKIYKHTHGGTLFLDDEGSIRNTAPHAWKEHNWPKASDVINEGVKCNPMEQYAKANKTDRKQIVAKSKAFGVQEGGTHYTDMQLQPLEATYLRYGLVGLKAAIHTKVDKYISRKKDDEIGQLKKAHHCLAILVEITELEKQNDNS